MMCPPESVTLDLHVEEAEQGEYLQIFNVEAEPSVALSGPDRDVSRLLQVANNAIDLIGGIASGRDAERLAPALASARMSLERVGEQLLRSSSVAWECGAETVCLADCLAEMTPLLHSMCPADIRLDIQACPYLPHTVCDGVALEAVIMSLIFNARSALAGGGVISIIATSRSDRLDRAGVVLLVASSPPEREGARIERKSRTALPSPATAALSLATASHFAARVGGRLVVETERGGKAVIALHLPVIGTSPAAQERMPVRDMRAGSGHRNRDTRNHEPVSRPKVS